MGEKEETSTKILDEIFSKLDLKSLIDTAIFEALTKEAKDKLVQGILEYLSEETGRWDKKTRIQQHFEESITPIVKQKMTEIISNDAQVMAEIERCVKEATQKFIGMDKETLISNLSKTMENAFRVRDYD
jgi:2-hydroxy-3-keto-5-methylthiopentenyl-1-phosphate phosphatase